MVPLYPLPLGASRGIPYSVTPFVNGGMGTLKIPKKGGEENAHGNGVGQDKGGWFKKGGGSRVF